MRALRREVCEEYNLLARANITNISNYEWIWCTISKRFRKEFAEIINFF
jgi:hypothetical protein